MTIRNSGLVHCKDLAISFSIARAASPLRSADTSMASSGFPSKLPAGRFSNLLRVQKSRDPYTTLQRVAQTRVICTVGYAKQWLRRGAQHSETKNWRRLPALSALFSGTPWRDSVLLLRTALDTRVQLATCFALTEIE